MEIDEKKIILFCQFGGLGEMAIQRTFERLGYIVYCFETNTNNYDYDKKLMNRFLERMNEKRVDIVFSINFFPIISKICNVFRTLYISWIYDCPELHLYSFSIKNKTNKIFIFDRAQYKKFHLISPETVYYMPLATEPFETERWGEITEEEHNQYDVDICFMGSLNDLPERRYQELEMLPDYWKGFIQGIVEAQLNVFGYNFIGDSLLDRDVRELQKLLGFELMDEYQRVDRDLISDFYIGPIVSTVDRRRTIQRLSKYYKITVYTGSDTKGISNIENRGFADSITMMPKIFHCSKINLNITSKTIQTGIPLRVFDVLGAGGFLITNYQQELYDYFEPGNDLVVYEDLDDLLDKVKYYLCHEKERQVIADNGYRKICKYYTYDIAITEILKQSRIV